MKENEITRKSNCDGIFYPDKNTEIISLIKNFFLKINESPKDQTHLDIVKEFIKNKKVLTFIVPHGSYLFSGYVSSFAYYLIKHANCKNYIILSSDHNGVSPSVSVMENGCWTTPLGKVLVDNKLGSQLLQKEAANDFIYADHFSLEIDHTIESQLPFLQFINNNDFKFLPLLQRTQDKSSAIKLARILQSVIPEGEKLILITTSNLCHYLHYDDCYAKDHGLISAILSLDINSFYDFLYKNMINICGYGCIASAMEFSRLSCNFDGIMLKHQTSGDIDNNKASVVGYSSLVIL
ncbi:MAG: AmmeMemoRadiSam system protein B [Thermoproteota archaeon]|nr:AmmeMemoRadiSam system protein B [Thermoproteota archaeon]